MDVIGKFFRWEHKKAQKRDTKFDKPLFDFFDSKPTLDQIMLIDRLIDKLQRFWAIIVVAYLIIGILLGYILGFYAQ